MLSNAIINQKRSETVLQWKTWVSQTNILVSNWRISACQVSSDRIDFHLVLDGRGGRCSIGSRSHSMPHKSSTRLVPSLKEVSVPKIEVHVEIFGVGCNPRRRKGCQPVLRWFVRYGLRERRRPIIRMRQITPRRAGFG